MPAEMALFDDVVQLIAQCVTILKKKKREDVTGRHPRMDALGCCSRRLWRDIQNKLGSVRSSQYLSWGRIIRSWNELGIALEVEKYPWEAKSIDDFGSQAAFGPSERCGWKNCLCSVYKPIHRLRVCKGCYRVAYCNPDCQTKYILFVPLGKTC